MIVLDVGERGLDVLCVEPQRDQQLRTGEVQPWSTVACASAGASPLRGGSNPLSQLSTAFALHSAPPQSRGQVNHMCMHRGCLSPPHMYLGTQGGVVHDNRQRVASRKGLLAAVAIAV